MIFAPVEVIIITLAAPAELNVRFALFSTAIFEDPLLSDPVEIVVNVRFPAPSVVIDCPDVPPVIFTLAILPKFTVPAAVSDVSVPNEVTFGCAAVVSVPVSKEPRTVPLLA